MKKRTYALMAAALILISGCGRIVKNAPAPSATPAPKRKDITGNAILESKARGTVKTVSDTEIVVQEEEKEHTFFLSDGAKADAEVLGINEGVMVIVNYRTEADGRDNAVSLEKVVG